MRMLKKFISEYKKSFDSKKAFEKAEKSIRNCISSWEIKNSRQIIGLYGELVYFYKSFQEQELTAEMVIGYKSDFRGKETLLFAKYLRDEHETWTPRIAIPEPPRARFPI